MANLFTYLAAEGFSIARLNPLRTHRFAGEDLERAKTDRIAGVMIARFAAQKRPSATRMPEAATQELRERVRMRDRLVRESGDRRRQLHRLVDLGFPEFTHLVPHPQKRLATALLAQYPTAAAFQQAAYKRVAKLRYDGRHTVGEELAQALIQAARTSVGRHHGPAYHVQIRYACEDIEVFGRRIQHLADQIEPQLREHEVGRLLPTIEGIGSQTAARLVSELGHPAEFRSAAALATYVGVVPGTQQSGTRQLAHARLAPIGHARLRAALWRPTLVATRFHPWLRAYYERLRARGKLPKVARIAALRKFLAAVFSVAKSRRPFTPHVRD